MKHRSTYGRATFAILLSMSAAAASATPCEEVIGTIDGKLKARGITDYTLTAIPREDVKTQRVVGSCDVGLKKIIFERTVAAVPAAAPAGTTVAQNSAQTAAVTTTAAATPSTGK